MAETKFTGIGVSDGIRIGKVIKLANASVNNEYTDVAESQAPAEKARFQEAREKCIKELDALIEQVTKDLGEEKAGILKGQRSFLSDPAFCPSMEKMIGDKFFSAEKAVKSVTENFAGIFEKMPNEYMKERAADVRDVGKRLLSALSGEEASSVSSISREGILVVEDLSPSDTVSLNKNLVLGLITQKGGKTSHTAIFSRSMGMPAIVGIGLNYDLLKNEDNIIIDGTSGLCIIDPEEKTLNEYREKAAEEEKSRNKLMLYKDKKAVTKDGFHVEILANIGSQADAAFACEQGAEGVGLLRTELIYMAQETLPDEETQFVTYRSILEEMKGKSVIIRTLDIGGDKKLPYLSIPEEMNPFLGYRAIRLCLDQKHILRTQLRAILRASAYGKAKIMFPMISSLDEWRKARDIYMEVREALRNEGLKFDENIELGIMVEIPSAAVMAEQFAKEVDFFSIGTNDLVQYTLAVDRMNEKIAYLYDHFHPAVISLIKNVSNAAHKYGKYVGMCGGMAGDPLAIPLLVALGLHELSMSAGSIPPAKYLVNQLSLEECRKLEEKVSECATAGEIRDLLKEFVGQYDM